MITHNQSRIIQVPVKFLYDIIKDVEKYHQFLPWCTASRVFNKTQNGFDGELEIDFKIYKSRYLSKVSLINLEDHYQIISESQNNNVFKKLYSVWDLRKQEQYCFAKYSIEFQFQNILFQQVSQLFLNEVVHKTTEAFEQRAMKLYENHSQNQLDVLELVKDQLNQKQLKHLQNNKQLIEMINEMHKNAGQERMMNYLQDYFFQQQI
ncbi:Coenzyme Q-binding protein coq10a [Paramecium bursaria]